MCVISWAPHPSVKKYVIFKRKKICLFMNLIVNLYSTKTCENRALGGILKVGGPTLVKFLKKKILKGPLFSKFSKSGWALIEFCLENLVATSMATFSITWFLQSDIVLKSSILRSLPTLWSRKYCLQKKACISGMHSLRVASFRIFSTYINSETSNSQTMHLLTMHTRNTSPYSIIFHLLHLGDEFYQTFLFNYLIPSLWQDSRKDTYNKSNT